MAPVYAISQNNLNDISDGFPKARLPNKLISKSSKIFENNEYGSKESNWKSKSRTKLFELLRHVILFGAPVMLCIVMFMVLAIIYVIRPYVITKDFTQTVCQTVQTKVLENVYGSCSAGTDAFQPCVQILVSYATGNINEYKEGILMENEQALINCNKCSFTFGTHGMFHNPQTGCDDWDESFEPSTCVKNFLERQASNSTFPCYFNHGNYNEVVRELVLGTGSVVHSLIWPLLSFVLYGCSYMFVTYEKKKLSILLKSRQVKNASKPRSDVYFMYSNEYKRRRLSQSLGFKSSNEGRLSTTSQLGHLSKVGVDSKRMSLSLPSVRNLTFDEDLSKISVAIDDTLETNSQDDFSDMRHLDLAVSEQNVEELSENFSHFSSSLRRRSNPNKGWEGNPYNTLPANLESIPETQSPTKPVATDAVSITTSTMVSEQEIDFYYKLLTQQNKKLAMRFNSKSETTV